MRFHSWFHHRHACHPGHGRHDHDVAGDPGFHAARRGVFDRFGDDEGFSPEHGRGGRHGHGRGGARMLGHGDLKLLLLSLIEQQPRHGYELIRIIEEMFQGRYSPSPGAVYPTLTMLEEMGHAQAQAEGGGRKLYAITDEGRAYLEENRAVVDAVVARAEHSAREAAREAAPMAVRQAMHALRHAMLSRRSDWDEHEARRIVAILERAAAEILAGARRD
ncbi:PadR family transcriptional regulator [Luteimonas aquatica]|uniref:PadR family transcriptional regulator n=1 Tax=Luteimonas aquatica TaxID=450364 RepID=UPI001F5A6E4E|nr:PadR family transcriptional regulator [Luteimonas aquatica]